MDFDTVNGTATAGADYLATNGMFTWADGETNSKSCTVRLVDDPTEESDEFFTVGLSGAALGPNTTAYITIVNDDFVVRPALQVLQAGTRATLSITPTANAVGFQWWKDGVGIGNATNATLTVANVQTNDTGNYWATVTTTVGTATSSTGRVVVATPVAITS